MHVEYKKVMAIDAMNEVRRLCFGGALLSALILEKLTLLKKVDFLKKEVFFKVLRFLL